MRRKKERSKQATRQSNKAKQHSTPKAVTFPKKSELPWVGLEPTTLYNKYMYIIIVYRLLYIHAYYGMCVCNDVHVHVLCLGCHGTVDYNRYPSESVQKKWITHYLEECARLKGIYTLGIFIYITVHVLMRDEKEGRKEASKVKQSNKAKHVSGAKRGEIWPQSAVLPW